jgi:GNAT superfamily N-acetyltransferase
LRARPVTDLSARAVTAGHWDTSGHGYECEGGRDAPGPGSAGDSSGPSGGMGAAIRRAHGCVFAGSVTMRPAVDGRRLEHFYVAPGLQGRGLGSAVLRALECADADGVLVRLNVLQGSAARRLYERHGFTVEVQNPIDVYMVRRPGAGALGRERSATAARWSSRSLPPSP